MLDENDTPTHVRKPGRLTANKPRTASRAPSFPPIARPSVYEGSECTCQPGCYARTGREARTHLPISTPFAPELKSLMISAPVLIPLSNNTVSLNDFGVSVSL